MTARVPKTLGRLPWGTPMRDPFRLANPVDGAWQLAQAVPRGSDKFVSLNIFSPKSCKAVLTGAGAITGLDAAGAGTGATVKGLADKLVVWAAAALGIAATAAAGGLGAEPAGLSTSIAGLGAPGGGLRGAPPGGAGAARAPKSTSALLATMAKAAP